MADAGTRMAGYAVPLMDHRLPAMLECEKTGNSTYMDCTARQFTTGKVRINPNQGIRTTIKRTFTETVDEAGLL